MTDHEFLFSVTVYRDGQIRVDGKGNHAAMPSILRLIAASLENGSTVLGEYDDPDEN
jgi:hypothetical protein